MKKRFNVTGTCIPGKHYMVDISGKLRQIKQLIQDGFYFTINRPRQYGKTTTMFLLKKHLQNEYVIIRTSFEGIGDSIFENEKTFSETILGIFADALAISDKHYSEILNELGNGLKSLKQVSKAITDFVSSIDKEVVLMIDEVDKSSNNQLFLSFLGMLRSKYLMRNEGEDHTFQSVILAGVHDVKTLKIKLRPDAEQKYNSPWNIAVDFDIDMSFLPDEISTMLKDYSKDKNIKMNIENISKKLYYYTSGYPFLISRLCKIIDEYILPEEEKKEWTAEDIENAFEKILKEDNTNFASLIKNLENNRQLYETVFDMLIKGTTKTYNRHNPIINIGETYGIFKNQNGTLKIHNRIYEQLIYDYMSSKIEMSVSMGSYNYKGNLTNNDCSLDFEKLLLKFQQFMKEQYSRKDMDFVERSGKLLFLAFLKPVINGNGFDFKEVQISEEKRLDIVVTYLNYRYVIELKVWYGPKAHEKGIDQLNGYLERLDLDKGYLVIFDTTKSSQNKWKKDRVVIDNREIFMVWV